MNRIRRIWLVFFLGMILLKGCDPLDRLASGLADALGKIRLP